MSPLLQTYALYMLISIAITVWVARTLHFHGRPFLIDVFHGRIELADAVNRLMVVGFYLVNLAFVSFYLSQRGVDRGAWETWHALTRKIGTVLIVIGVMHFGNLVVFCSIRKRWGQSAAKRLEIDRQD